MSIPKNFILADDSGYSDKKGNVQGKALCTFHFKIDAKMKQNLQSMPLCKKEGGLARMIEKVLDLLSPGIEKMHVDGEQQYTRYELVCEDMEVERKSVYVGMPERLYRELKCLHNDLNYYSMAQLLRRVLRGFLGMVEKYGDEVEAKMLEFYRRWKRKRASRKHEWKPVEELLFFIYQKPKQSRFLTLYSKKFQPISIYRL
jgi:hypothetical protein